MAQLILDLGGNNVTRILSYKGEKDPRISAVPVGSPNDQPLYGLGASSSLSAVYVRNETDLENTCFSPPWGMYVDDYCLASVRNFPYEGWSPAFVVWPVNAQQVQASVRFAVAHNLCIMVAGTGHDFLNRHSCKDGVFIRTALMKDIVWDLNDTKKLGNPDGSAKLGAGLVWSEVHHAASLVNRYVSSGWAATVGVVGWSIGGGHGPFGPSQGLGVDKILEVDIVLNDGSLVTANANNSHSDLFWAIRGGGGSTWGVITSITVKAHKIPKGGFTRFSAIWEGTFCNKSLA